MALRGWRLRNWRVQADPETLSGSTTTPNTSLLPTNGSANTTAELLNNFTQMSTALRSRRTKRMIWTVLLWSGGILILVTFIRFIRRRMRRRPLIQKQEHVMDVCIVGAGPSGASCAYYLARAGRDVLLLERQRIPHDKVCGDVIAPLAQHHLREMNVLDDLVNDKEGKWASSGGFVSPSGRSFLGKLTTGEKLLACQRIILDDKIAKAAEAAGATLYEGADVLSVELDKTTNLWEITLSTCDLEGKNFRLYAHVLVAADGAESHIARRLGIVTEPPTSYCCRSFAKAGTHAFPKNANHVVFYSRVLMPGFFTVFHELEDFLNLSCYFIPCSSSDKWGKLLQRRKTSGNSTDWRRDQEILQKVYEKYLRTDPHVKKALGKDVVITPTKFAPIRVGGVSKSYGDQVVVVGDAAGQVDPLTGGGIHYGLEAGKLAADTIDEGFKLGDISAEQMQKYHNAWKSKFGFEFWISYKILYMLHKFPFLLDAGAAVIKRKGEGFIGAWATALMGGRSKIWFFFPRCSGPILLEVFVQWWKALWSKRG